MASHVTKHPSTKPAGLGAPVHHPRELTRAHCAARRFCEAGLWLLGTGMMLVWRAQNCQCPNLGRTIGLWFPILFLSQCFVSKATIPAGAFAGEFVLTAGMTEACQPFCFQMNLIQALDMGSMPAGG